MLRAITFVTMIGWMAASAASAAPAGEPIVWRTPTVQFKLVAPQDGMGLLSIRQSDGQQVEFFKTPNMMNQALLWRIELTPDTSDPKAFIVLDNTSPAAARDCKQTDDGLILVWKNVALPQGGGSLDVTVRANADAAHGFTNWRIDVTNRSTRYGIWRVIFPVMELQPIDGSGEDDYLICSPAEGRSVRDPIGLDAIPREDRVTDSLNTDMAPVLIKSQMSAEFGFGAARPHGLPYPSERGQMQLSAYYQKQGSYYYSSARKGPGLYFTPQDGHGYPKLFFYTPDAKRGVLTYEMANFPDSQGKPGLDYHMPYPMVIGGFSGDWYDAARIYRQWALEQPWAAKGPLANRKDIPDWLTRQVGTFRLDVKRANNASLMPLMHAAREQLPGIWMAQWYNWSQGEKGDAKGYSLGYALPPVADAPPGFDKLVDWLQGHHIVVFPYVNSRMWLVDGANYSLANPYVSRDADGKVPITGYGAAHICVQTEYWKHYLADVCAKIVNRYHPAGLYLDQAGSTSFGGVYNRNGCFDPSHGHPLGVTQSLVQAEHERMEAILKATQKSEPHIVLSGEGVAENFIDVMANKLVHYEIWPGYVPLYSAVYHDYQTFYGRTTALVARDPSDPMPQMQIGWQLVIGDQIGRVWASSFSEKQLSLPIVKRNLDYLRRAATVRQNLPEFLITGQMLRPPVLLSEAPLVTTHEFRRDQVCSLPGILAGVWQSPDGRIALVATNISSKPLDVRMGLPHEGVGNREVQQVYPTTAPVELDSSGQMPEVNFHLEPYEIRVMIWSH